MVASEASIALTKTLISEKIVQGAEAEMWLTQLAFIPRPTVEMLAAIQVGKCCHTPVEQYIFSVGSTPWWD